MNKEKKLMALIAGATVIVLAAVVLCTYLVFGGNNAKNPPAREAVAVQTEQASEPATTVATSVQAAETTTTATTSAATTSTTSSVKESAATVAANDIKKDDDTEKPFRIAPAAIGDIKITPLNVSEYGIKPDTDFIVEASAETTAEELFEVISLSGGGGSGGFGPRGGGAKGVSDNGGGPDGGKSGGSGKNFKITKDAAGGNKFVLSVNKPFNNNQIVNLVYSPPEKRPLSFAFQTENLFGVSGTTPGDGSYNVPVNAGIEITFNRRIAAGFDISDFIDIRPRMDGSFDRYGNTFVFIPNELKGGVSYEVVVKSGVKGEDGAFTKNDYRFTFNTEWISYEQKKLSVEGDIFETFMPDEAVRVEVTASEDIAGHEYRVERYELTLDDYAGFDAESGAVPDGAKLAETILTGLVESESYYYWGPYKRSFIILNEPLAEGYHLLKITTDHPDGEITAYKLIQSSYLSVYSISLTGETCFWINDSASGKPAVSARITAISGDTGGKAGSRGFFGFGGRNAAAGGVTTAVTDKDGVAVMETTWNDSVTVKIDYPGYKTFVYKNRTYDPYETPINAKYHAYLYTDRTTYKPTDKIDIFGVVKRRDGFQQSGEDAKVTVNLGDIAEIHVTPDAYGCFAESVAVADMHDGAYLELRIGGEILKTAYIRFQDYQKNAYQFTPTLDKSVYFDGETAVFGISAATYDGTPVEGVTLVADGATFITDENGTVSGALNVAKNAWRTGWYPYGDYFSVSMAGSEDYMQSVYAKYMHLPSDVMLEHKNAGKGAIEFRSYRIDSEALERYVLDNGNYYPEPDKYRGAAVDLNFKLEVVKHTHERFVAGEQYSYFEKKTIPKYDTRVVEESYKTIQGNTANGYALLEGLPYSDDANVWYTGKVSFFDMSGRLIAFDIYDGFINGGYGSDTIKNYYFKLDQNADNNIYMSNRLGLNETGRIKLSYDGADGGETISEGVILAIPARERIVGAATGSPSGMPFKFTAECMTNVRIYGAYFDGKYIHQIVYPLHIEYDSAERGLEFEVGYDKDGYKPGDTVKMTVKAADKAGKPKQTLINVSVVDEKAFSNAYYKRDVAFLNEYYDSIYLYNMTSYVYTSHSRFDIYQGGDGGAEQGGEGDDNTVRKDFVENPAFGNYETDANGFASISFKLPDNITSWQVTVHGVTKDGFAGDSQGRIISSLPYYVDVVMTDDFIAGDDVSLFVKSFGREYKLYYTDAAYSVEIYRGGVKVFNDSQSSLSYAGFNAGKLPEGEYTARISGDTGKYRDAVEKTFKVKKDGILISYNRTQVLSKDESTMKPVNIGGSPVRLTISNGEIAPLMKIVRSFFNRSSGRTDYLAAAEFARYFIYTLRGKADTLDYVSRAQKSVLIGYGIPEVVYGDADLFFTARFAASFPELVDKRMVRDYVYESGWPYNRDERLAYAEDEARRAAGYLALAAVGEVVLLDIGSQLDAIYTDKDQSKFRENYYERLRMLYYAAALCVVGDETGAKSLMDKYPVSDKALNSMGVAEREMIETLTLFIDVSIDPEKAFAYLQSERENKYVSDVCEKVNFIKKAVAADGVTSEVSYTLDGVAKSQKLRNFDRISLVITREQFEGLNLRNVSGVTAVDIQYYGYGEDLDDAGKRIRISKTVTDSRISFDVEMPNDAPDGWYIIKDRIPSNMRYAGGDDWAVLPDGTSYYIDGEEKQLVNIGFYVKKRRNVSVGYNVIKVSDADAVAGAAYVGDSCGFDRIWGKSD